MYKMIQGFVLIEVMTVVSVIGILATMSLPSYLHYVKRTKVSEAFTVTQPIMRMVTDYYAYYGQLPVSNQDLALPKPEEIRGSQVKSVQIKSGSIHVTFFDPMLQGILTLRPTILPTALTKLPAYSLTWVCGHASALPGMRDMSENKTSIKPQYLPLSCQ